MEFRKVIQIICLFLCTRSYHCVCISDGTDPIQCSISVSTTTGIIVRLQPQLKVTYQICSSYLKIEATAKYGSTNLTVYANDTMATIELHDHNSNINPHDYSIDFTYTIYTALSCNPPMMATFQQMILVNYIDAPSITYHNDQPHTLTCTSSSNVTAVWFRFVKDGATLGYCGPELQTFAGGYTIYHPKDDEKKNKVCILEMTKKQFGLYTCATKFPGISGSLTSMNNVTLTPDTTKDYLDVAIGVGAGSIVFVIFVIIIAVIIVVVMIKRYKNNLHRYQRHEPEQGGQGDDD